MGIYSIAGIFGNNGAGKCTTLTCLMDILLEGSAVREFDGVLVYESDRVLYLYQNLQECKFTIESDGVDVRPLKCIEKLEVFY